MAVMYFLLCSADKELVLPVNGTLIQQHVTNVRE